DLGLNVVLKEGYSINAPDLSSLVTKLRSVRPDVLYHTGYNPDISLFLRQAKEQGLRLRAYIGHGAGHSQLDKLKEAFGKDVEFFHTLDPIASQLLDPKKLKPGIGELTAEMVKRYKTQYDPNVATAAIAPHVSMGFNNLWILFNDVLPRAIQKHGGFGPDALAAAARETDIPDGGTMQGYGVKFYPPGHRFAGQNLRAFPAVFQIIEGKFELVYPQTVATAQPVLPLPAASIRLRGEEIAGLTPDAICHRGIARTFQIPRPFRKLTILENVAVAAHFGSARRDDEATARRRAHEILALVGLPADGLASTTLLGAGGLKKLELARALATGPRLLLADESLGGLDSAEMATAAEMLKRIRGELGIT